MLKIYRITTNTGDWNGFREWHFVAENEEDALNQLEKRCGISKETFKGNIRGPLELDDVILISDFGLKNSPYKIHFGITIEEI